MSPPSLAAALDDVAAVADAVLFEGYLLYPYRASAQKNRLRWQFGVITPATDAGEPTASRTECLFEPGSRSVLRLRLRFLHVQDRVPHAADGEPVDELTVDGRRHLRFEEGAPRCVDVELEVDDLLDGPRTVPVRLPGGRSVERLTGGAGTLVRTSGPVAGRVVVSAVEVAAASRLLRLRWDVVNDGTCATDAPREDVLRTSFVAAHTVAAARPGVFLSLTDPPRWAAGPAAECVNEHTWPVLAGPEGRADLLLSSPIILADHPQVAPESTVNLFDGLENDEILTLRTLVLTDEEKAEARATDPRAAEIINAVEGMPPDVVDRLHGAIRSMRPAGDDRAAPEPDRLPWWDPAADAAVHPETDSVLVGDVPVARGSRVVLRPGPGGDAHDLFFAGLPATVQAVVHDVDGGVHVAVSVDGDPAAETQLAHGRFRYFRPDELEVP